MLRWLVASFRKPSMTPLSSSYLLPFGLSPTQTQAALSALRWESLQVCLGPSSLVYTSAHLSRNPAPARVAREVSRVNGAWRMGKEREGKHR
jgi:hypothetical protein